MRTIRVTGRGNIKVRPDMTRLTIALGGVFPDYAEAISRSTAQTEAFRELLVELGFKSTDLKTLAFYIDAEYENYSDEHERYKRQFVGYRYSHELKIEFLSDNELLGKTLFKLGQSKFAPEFRISFTVSDPEAAKNELLGKAVQDAVEKAEVLAKAAGLSLGAIQTVDYSWGEINLEVSPIEKSMMCPDAAPSEMDIEPNDLEMADTVTVVWEIE